MPKIRLKQINEQELGTYVNAAVQEAAIALNPSVLNNNPTSLDFSYNLTNANINEKYLNVFNSIEDVTASLPAVQNKKRFLIKNLNYGVVTVLPSGTQKIDGYSQLNVLSGQSLELLGVSEINLTGWIVINSYENLI